MSANPIETGTIVFAGFALSAVTARTTVPLLRYSVISLPYRGWMPYNFENTDKTFWLTFVFQTLGVIFSTISVIASDTYIIVMLLQLCSQIEILKHRMKTSPKQYKKLNSSEKQETNLVDWVQHHNSLYYFRNKLNDPFGFVFLCQLLEVTLEVCLSSYLLTKLSVTSAKFWEMLLSITFIMSELYIFCWYGNLVMEKSSEIEYAAFSSDWNSLSIKSRKNLILIIGRSKVPIQFTAGSIIPLSIQTFTSILRLGYSIYNCLK